jgi:hypothetical protein
VGREYLAWMMTIGSLPFFQYREDVSIPVDSLLDCILYNVVWTAYNGQPDQVFPQDSTLT